MASLKVAVGTFFNRKFNSNGMATSERIPFLPKTIAKLVYMASGESVEHAMLAHCNELDSLSTKVTKLENGESGAAGTTVFNSMEEYQTALQNKTASPNAIYVVKD